MRSCEKQSGCDTVRELIVAGTREGLAAARARGRVGGRPTVVTPDLLRAARDMLPTSHILRRRFPDRWARFHTLPQSQRYATSSAEHAEILRRHHALLSALGAEVVHGGTLIAITCSWSATPAPTPRDSMVASATPTAMHWRSDDLAYEPGFHSWQHHHASMTTLHDQALDVLLLLVADDMTDGVILTDTTCAWAYHPYDGGADAFAADPATRDRLLDWHADWLPPDPTST